MLAIWSVLRKTFINEYYRLNAGFFFVILMFAGGFLRAEDHIALAAYIVQSPFLLAIVFGFWGLYHLKTVWFVRQRLLFDSHFFLYNLLLLPRWQRWGGLLLVQYGLWLPVMAYAAFMGYYGQQTCQKWGIIATFLFVVLVPFTGLWVYEQRLWHPNPDQRANALGMYLNRRFVKPVWSYFLWYLVRQEPVLFLLTKLFTGGVVMGLCLLYPTDTYDERLLSLAGILAGIGHVIKVFHLYEFEHLQLPLLRNLPFSLGSRFGSYSLLFLLLILPEILLFARYLPAGVSIWYALQWVGWLLSLVWLIFARFLAKHYVMDYILRQTFYAFVVFFLLIMFRVPLIALTLLNIGIAVWGFKKHYYSSEYLMPQ
jgi:hypothetical protein